MVGDHGEQAGDDVVLRDGFGVVERMDDTTSNAGVACARVARRPLEIVAQRGGEELAECRAMAFDPGTPDLWHRIRVSTEGRGAPLMRSREKFAVNFDDERDFALDRAFRRATAGEFVAFTTSKVRRVSEARRQWNRRIGAGSGDRNRCRQMFRVRIDREAEQEQLHQWHADDHRQREPVAAHLDKIQAPARPATRAKKRSLMRADLLPEAGFKRNVFKARHGFPDGQSGLFAIGRERMFNAPRSRGRG